MTADVEQTVGLTVHVPESVRAQLDALAEATDRTRQYHALEALRQYIMSEAWIVARVQEGIADAEAGRFAAPERIAAVLGRYVVPDVRLGSI